MPTILDAFSKEDRTEITVSQLIQLIDDRARAEAKTDIMLRMCRNGIAPEDIAGVFERSDIMNIDEKWLTETEATAYVRELKQRISTLEDLNDRLMKENGKLEKQLEVVQTAKGIDDMQIAHYDDDLKHKTGIRAVAEIERLRTENKKAKELLKAACEDIKYLINHAERNGKACDRCKYGNEMYCYADDCRNDAKWQHEAEALALIGEDGDINA